MQVKLDEVIGAPRGALKALLGPEDLAEEELDRIRRVTKKSPSRREAS